MSLSYLFLCISTALENLVSEITKHSLLNRSASSKKKKKNWSPSKNKGFATLCKVMVQRTVVHCVSLEVFLNHARLCLG